MTSKTGKMVFTKIFRNLLRNIKISLKLTKTHTTMTKITIPKNMIPMKTLLDHGDGTQKMDMEIGTRMKTQHGHGLMEIGPTTSAMNPGLIMDKILKEHSGTHQMEMTGSSLMLMETGNSILIPNLALEDGPMKIGDGTGVTGLQKIGAKTHGEKTTGQLVGVKMTGLKIGEKTTGTKTGERTTGEKMIGIKIWEKMNGIQNGTTKMDGLNEVASCEVNINCLMRN